jgi:hypothetical protein
MIATSDDGLCEDNARMSASFLHQDGMDFVISLARLWIGGNASYLICKTRTGKHDIAYHGGHGRGMKRTKKGMKRPVTRLCFAKLG